MKTNYTPFPPAAAESEPSSRAAAVFTLDQRVLFVNTDTRQRESMPLAAALVTAANYFSARAPFALVDLDDELLASFNGTDLDAKQPLAEMLMLCHQVVSKTVRKAIVSTLEQVHAEATRRQLEAEQAGQSASVATEHSDSGRSQAEPEPLGPFE
jgi:hypothetical protein